MRTILRIATATALLAVAAPAARPAAASPPAPTPALWVMNADGTNQRPLVPQIAYYAEATWSPDSSRLAYADYDGTYVVDLASGTRTRLGPGRTPAWSPGGGEIAFVIPGEYGGPATLAVSAPDGTGLRVLTTTAASDGPVAWSPDGSRIAFPSCDRSGCIVGVSVMKADGTGEREVAPGSRAPSWSPDGTRLAVESYDPATRSSDIFVVDVSSRSGSNVTPGARTGIDPQWGPTGQIAYTGRGDDGEAAVVWLASSAGTDSTLVHEGFGAEWSPDGSRIVFAHDGGLRVHAPGTQGAPVLTPGGEDELMPSWAPDGRSIAYVSQEPRPVPPEYERWIGVSASRGTIRAEVEVEDDFRLCSRRVPVKLQRRTGGEWVADRRGRSDDQGRVEWSAGNRRGTYRVVAPGMWTGFPGDSDRCLRAASPRFRLGG